MALTVAQAPAPPPLSPDAVLDYDGPADHSKIRVNMARPVDRDVAGAFVAGLAEQAGLRDDQWSMLPARPLSKQFVVQLRGGARAASRRAALLLAVLHGPDGEWKKMSVKDTLGQDVAVYVDPDRNGRQLKAEAMLRRVARAVKVASSDGQAFANYHEWTVTKAWRPLAKVNPGALREEACVLWNDAAIVSLGISRDVVKREMARLAGERSESVAWSS